MRPPAPMTRQWIGERNSFPVRGLVMYRWPNDKWACNVELLRITREEIGRKPAAEAAFEIALSALYCFMTNAGQLAFDGETVLDVNRAGVPIQIPKLALDTASILVPAVLKLIEEGGGAVTPSFIRRSQRIHSKQTTGSVKNAEDWNLPALAKGATRKTQILEHEKAASKHRLKAMANRRRMLARFWLNNKGGFFKRGLVFTTDGDGFWKFNVEGDTEHMLSVQGDGVDLEPIAQLSSAVSRNAVAAFASGVNVEKGGTRLLRGDLREVMVPESLSNEVLATASTRLAARLSREMLKHRHGVLGLGTIERCLVLAWDPEDTKPLAEYPFPMAPSEAPQTLDRWALDKMQTRQAEKKKAAGSEHAPVAKPGEDRSGSGKSWREELEIEDWVPLDEPLEDDATIDERALQLADHDQSAALRRIRADAGGTGTKEKGAGHSPVKHEIDYAGLPKDDE